MDGVIEKSNGQNIIIEIYFLSDELKKKIRDELTTICHGEYALTSVYKEHSFEYTIKELIRRIPNEKRKKVGIIGELLLNVVIREFTEMRIISPFFNLEERNVKKGFDIIAIDSNMDLWIIESKAGELGALKTSTEKVCERINVAKHDLNTRLNKQNSQLWLNAINSVRCALNDTNEKKTIVNILNANNTHSSNDKNVVLGGTVFCMFDSKIDKNKISELYKSIKKTNIFSKLKLIAIQKKTYEAILEYLNELVQG